MDEKANLWDSGGGSKLAQSFSEDRLAVCIQMKICILPDPTIPLLGISLAEILADVQ